MTEKELAMGYERYLQNTDPRGDYDVHDDLGRPRSDRPRSSDWDRGEDYRARSGYESGTYSGGNRTQASDYGLSGDRAYRGSYASDGHRFTETNNNRDARPSGPYGERGAYGFGDGNRGQHRDSSQNNSDNDRGFLARAGDEVRTWFGDEDAERRRRQDQQYDESINGGSAHHDRDYDEYRQENQNRFHTEFNSWRTERTGQRNSLSQVTEHMEVVGSDGEHVGTVDMVRGDRIVLTKSDANAGGHHHSIPSRWIQTVDDKVTIRKTASEAMAHWKDEERNQALLNGPKGDGSVTDRDVTGSTSSFSATRR